MGLLDDAQAARTRQAEAEKAKAAADERGVALMGDAVEGCVPEFLEAAQALNLRPPPARGFMKRAWFVRMLIYAAEGSEQYIAATVEVRGNGSWSWSTRPWALSGWDIFDPEIIRTGVREAFLAVLR